MFRSMTAYARAEFTADLGEDGAVAAVQPRRAETLAGDEEAPARSADFAITIRSVNSRFLDLGINLPREFRELNDQVARLARERVRRGKLDISVNWLGVPPEAMAATLDDDEVLREYLARLRRIYRHREGVPIDMADPVALLAMIDASGKRRGSAPGVPGVEWRLLQPCLNSLFDEFDDGRQSEGGAIRSHLKQNHANCQELLHQVNKMRQEGAEQSRQRLRKQIEELKTGHNPERLEEELLYLLKRHDIEEECNRLSAHLLALGEMLAGAGASAANGKDGLGKRINFLVQEMGREANTIGSKAASHEISMLGIEIKLELERLREQVANLE